MTLDSRKLAPTLEEVATAAGVSRSTASRVINGSSAVSPAVVAAVTSAIAELNYIPNRAARSLANRQTMAIALVVPEDTKRFFGDPYFAAIVDGISRGLEDSDYVLNLQLAGPSQKAIRYLLGGNVDGALVASHHAGDHFLSAISGSLPVVVNGRPLNLDEQDHYFVDVDNAAAAQSGTEYLLSKGRKRIGTIAGPPDMPAGVDRSAGWATALSEAGMPTNRLAYGDFTIGGGASAMKTLLDTWPDLDGVFVASDLMAVGAMGVLRDRGISVPDEISVVGFDDSPAATNGEIKLTTVRQPATEMGEKMARMLLGLLRGETIERQCIMPTSVIERDSA
jgi:LacI family transcriptional regulator